MQAKVIHGPWTGRQKRQASAPSRQALRDRKLMQTLFRRSHDDPLWRAIVVAQARAILAEKRQ